VATPEAGSDPSVLRMLLGAQLRQLREAKNITREEAGYFIRASDSKISRMELGRVGFKQRDVADLLELYGVQAQDRPPLMALARQSNLPGWWHKYGDVLPGWFQTYVSLEGAASLIRAYELQFPPGLLQTEDYARAVISLGHPYAPAEEIERRVEFRITRQQLLTHPGGPHLWVVVDEAALLRPVGGPKILRRQVEALIEVSERPNVTLQVIPLCYGGHAGAGGSFSILRFPGGDLPDVVYLEQLTGAQYLNRREDVDRYADAMERLCVEAEAPATTVDVLARSLQDR
jgi:transcriptional regulator with XRE-family HTH domain